VPLLNEYALTPVIHHPRQIELLGALARPVDVYFKVNSGMNRLGFTTANVQAGYQALRVHPRVNTVTLMTHFADADGATGVSAQRGRRMRVVASGSADGYPRHAGAGTPVLVNARRTRVVGRVSMDMLTVDLSDMPQAGIGAPVTLWGEGLSADEVAAAAGT